MQRSAHRPASSAHHSVAMLSLAALTWSAVLWSIPTVRSQGCNPGIEYFQLDGFLTAATVSDGPLAGPVDFLFSQELPLVRRVLASRNRNGPLIQSGNNVLYLETETERIIFDTGNGVVNDFGIGGQLIANLEAQDISRESITRVLLSHAHSDHIGGLLLDGNGTLAFPSASVHISRVEFDYWLGGGPPFSDSDLSPEMISNQEASIAPVLEQIEPMVELFEIGDEVLPNITAVRNASWHTPGSTIFRISGGAGPPVFFLGDAVIDEQLGFGHPYLKVAFDSVQAEASIGRVELLDAVAADAGLAVPSHVAFPALGQVIPNGVYFDFLRVPPTFSDGVATMCPA